MMAEIHNNPKLKGPRMPLILPREAEKHWIDAEVDPAELKDIIKPFDEGQMVAHPVNRLRGKNAGNTNRPDIWERYSYPEIDSQQTSLF